MWLLDTARAELHFFANPEDVPKPGFAILSHTWGKDEQTFQDVQRIRLECAKTYENPRNVVSDKIRKCCELAERDGYEWVWNDTCCIDKTSSAELSEAINSMFRYYSLSGVCYAYLEDVPPETASASEYLVFKESRWHKRGWTLQELIAPQIVIFLSSSWTFIGSKVELAQHLQRATEIPISLLRCEAEISEFSISQRMSWASCRLTTRKEDEAYALLGIFDISMPTLYGEGTNAFFRLQEEIIRRYPDTTLFASRLEYLSLGNTRLREASNHRLSLLASSPVEFWDGGRIRCDPDCPKIILQESDGKSVLRKVCT